MLRIVSAVAAIAVGGSLAYAQNLNAVKERREAMRAVAKAGSASFKMMKGEVPFDLAVVQATLKTVQEQAPKLKGLFPDDSKSGGATDAKPAIWESRADFDKAIETWVGIATAAAAAIKDEASFKAEYPKVAGACNGCHKADGGFAPGIGDSFKKLQTPL